MGEDKGFLSRWAQRKAAVREGRPLAEPAPAAPVPVASTPAPAPAPVAAPVASSPPPPPAPTLEDVAKLEPGAEVGAFVRPGVEPQVRNAALKKLFADPHFNVMDGLDVYIDDYGRPDPLPASMLRQLVQSQALGLFDDEATAAPRQAVVVPSGADPDGAAATAAPQSTPDSLSPLDPPHDDDAAVRLQPDDPAGSAGAADGAGQDAGRER